VNYFRENKGNEKTTTFAPTVRPTIAPSFIASNDQTASINDEIPSDDADYEIIRYGLITDRFNGNYSIEICPIIAGIYELHCLFKGKGISNQPFHILNKPLSILQSMGKGSHVGQYIDQSPYVLTVRHSVPSLITSTVRGDGLINATVGVTASFMLTVRDVYDNVLRDSTYQPTISLRLDKSPSAKTSVWNYGNGSYLLSYIPLLSGTNILSVFINNKQIYGSPYYVTTAVGIANASYSYAEGVGLVHGMTGQISYFSLFSYDLHNNRKTNYDDSYYFEISGSNNITGYMKPCPFPRDENHPICDVSDSLPGYYFGQFIPTVTGNIKLRIYLVNKAVNNHLDEISNSPFHAVIIPSSSKAEFTDISGTLYDNVAGVPANIYLQLRDYFKNILISGNTAIECAILGVGVEWGTVKPFSDAQGLPSQYNYKGKTILSLLFLSFCDSLVFLSSSFVLFCCLLFSSLPFLSGRFLLRLSSILWRCLR
jgi:hypothetical protein